MSYINPHSGLAARFWESGRWDDCPIYDFHGHMHELFGGYFPAKEFSGMTVTMKRAGIKSYFFCSHQAMTCAETGEKLNIEAVLESRKQSDVNVRAYLGVQSFNADFERDVSIFESNPGIYAGFKFWHGAYRVSMDSPILAPYWEYADNNKLLTLNHTWGGDAFCGAAQVRRVAERYPNVILICGHSCHGDWDGAIGLANGFPNVYLELTAVLDDRGILEHFVNKAGSERILFGTDLPWFSTFNGIGAVLDADITDGDRHNIFHRNGERLLERVKLS